MTMTKKEWKRIIKEDPEEVFGPDWREKFKQQDREESVERGREE